MELQRKVTLEWNPDDVPTLQTSILTGRENGNFMEMHKTQFAAHPYDRVMWGSRMVGLSKYPANLSVDHQWISPPTLAEEDAVDGRSVPVILGRGTRWRHAQA